MSRTNFSGAFGATSNPPVFSFQLPTYDIKRDRRDSTLTLRVNVVGKCDLHDREEQDLELEGPYLLPDS